MCLKSHVWFKLHRPRNMQRYKNYIYLLSIYFTSIVFPSTFNPIGRLSNAGSEQTCNPILGATHHLRTTAVALKKPIYWQIKEPRNQYWSQEFMLHQPTRNHLANSRTPFRKPQRNSWILVIYSPLFTQISFAPIFHSHSHSVEILKVCCVPLLIFSK